MENNEPTLEGGNQDMAVGSTANRVTWKHNWAISAYHKRGSGGCINDTESRSGE